MNGVNELNELNELNIGFPITFISFPIDWLRLVTFAEDPSGPPCRRHLDVLSGLWPICLVGEPLVQPMG